jgi:predicted DNA-binding transcriptional regulator AlpA
MAIKRANVQKPEVPPLPENLLDIQGVMKLLGVGRDKVFELMKYEDLPHIKWGARTLRFNPHEIARWLAEQSA